METPSVDRRWTDSPWFWLFAFGGMGLIALAAIAPKFARREQRLERMHEARQRVAAGNRVAANGAAFNEAAANGAGVRAAAETPGTDENAVTLAPLMLFLAAVLVVAGLAAVAGRLRRGGRARGGREARP